MRQIAAVVSIALVLALLPAQALAASPPSAPAIVRNATPGNTSATMSWTAPTDNGGSPITGYVVTPYVGYGARPATTFSSTATTQTITGLTNGTEYRFRVQATNAHGTSGYSTVTNPVTPAPTPPGAPAIIRTATAGDRDATVSWTAPTSDGGGAITGYVVTPYVGYGARPATTFSSTATTQTITGLTNGTEYRFRVQATNAHGTSGYSTVTNSVVPGAPSPMISAGGAHTCALRADGVVRCWGSGGAGQLGTGTPNDSLVPVTVTGLTGVRKLSAGGGHTCAVLGNGTVRCWGYNGEGQLGDGTTTSSATPVTVTGLSGVTAVDAGETHTCAVVADGTARCWGRNHHGQLGNGTTTDSFAPVAVTGLTAVTAIAVGWAHTCAVVAGGAKCWGQNDVYQQLGNTQIPPRIWDEELLWWDYPDYYLTPVSVTGLSGVTAITSGGDHTCALLGSSGTVKCWGSNRYGGLGDGTTTANCEYISIGPLCGSAAAVTVSGATGSIAVEAGSRDYPYTCAVAGDGSARCWGRATETFGAIGVPGITGATGISVGETHSCAMRADGTARCWGDNSVGQLGDGTITSSTTPVAVVGL